MTTPKKNSAKPLAKTKTKPLSDQHKAIAATLAVCMEVVNQYQTASPIKAAVSKLTVEEVVARMEA